MSPHQTDRHHFERQIVYSRPVFILLALLAVLDLQPSIGLQSGSPLAGASGWNIWRWRRPCLSRRPQPAVCDANRFLLTDQCDHASGSRTGGIAEALSR